MGLQLFELIKHDLDPFLKKLFEGGAFGHLAHPFEELKMTFGEAKEMVNNILSGKIEAYEKIDGQQISFSWKGGRLVGARNKNQLKEFGKNSLTADKMKDFFAKSANVPSSVVNAFYQAMVDLENALSKIPDPTLKNMFQEGKRFMNTEIVAEETANVIPYYKDYLVFHGLIEYDVNGNPIKQIDGSGKALENAVSEIGQTNQSKFQIKGPNRIVLKNFSEMPQERSKFLSELKKIQGDMPDRATIEQGQEAWWKKFILNAAKEMGYKIPETILNMLSARWGRLEKAVNTIPKIVSQIDNDQFKKWVIDYDKNRHEQQYKENTLPYELFFLRLGAEVLSNSSGFLTASPIKTVSDLAKGIQRDALKIKESKNVNDLNRLKVELERLEKIGKNKIVGSEGVVFSQNGKLYKLTGVFQPVHRILSILKYRKPEEEPAKAPTTKKEYANPSVLDIDAPENVIDTHNKFDQLKTESQSSLNLINVSKNPIDGTTKTTAIKENLRTMGDYDKDYEMVYGRIQEAFMNNPDGKADFSLVPSDLLKNIWVTFAKYGRVDEEKILKIWNILKVTSLKLIIYGKALNYKDPQFFYKDKMEDEETLAIRDKLVQYTHYTFTYQYENFSRLLKSCYTADTPEELLMAVDRILNFVHDRGSMASYLVQGGKSTLDDIAHYKSKGIHLTGRLFEGELKEGGNVVYTNSPLENKYMDATVKNALKIWGLRKLKYEIVGSKYKPIMNDLDVAISTEDLAKIIGSKPDDKVAFWSKVESFFKSHKPSDIPEPSFKVNKGLDQIHVSAPIVGQEGKFIQVDLMLGDVLWMKDALSGAADSKYKALYRNLLLATIMTHSHENTKDPNVVKRYQINWKKGLQSVDLINKAGKIEKANIQTVYNNPNDLAAFLFGPGTTFNDISSFEKLFKLLDSPNFRYKNKKTEIIDSFNDTLKSKGLEPINKE